DSLGGAGFLSSGGVTGGGSPSDKRQARHFFEVAVSGHQGQAISKCGGSDPDIVLGYRLADVSKSLSDLGITSSGFVIDHKPRTRHCELLDAGTVCCQTY